LWALRPHFFVLPALAALAGAASAEPAALSWRSVLAAVIAAAGWGAGQLLNDFLDRASDAINAPDRAMVAGRLTPRWAVVGAVLLASLALGATVEVHPRAWVLASLGGALLLLYDAAKRWPLLGNLAHGALMATVASIGRASVAPLDLDLTWSAFVRDALFGGWRTQIAVFAIAAWYLQSNYEKDRRGDRAAGDMTLAVVLSVRGSATLRACGILVTVLVTARLMGSSVSWQLLLAGGALGLGSTVSSLRRGTDQGAIEGYRFAVFASIVCLMALSAPLVGFGGTAALLSASFVTVAIAFRRSPNP
jgi:4-hydroxybenzoate polyprenyltransferase